MIVGERSDEQMRRPVCESLFEDQRQAVILTAHLSWRRFGGAGGREQGP